MHPALVVRWRIVPATSPRVIRHCPRCECDRPFASSGRFRVNAQKKRLDAWLIYRCSHCERSWNRPVFERKRVQEVDAALLERLHGNCPMLAEEWGNDLAALRGLGRAIEPFEPRIEKSLVADASEATRLRIELEGTGASPWRLDRLLAIGLCCSRSRIARWTEQGLLAAQRLALGGQAVQLNLSALPDEERRSVTRAAADAS